jgi:N-acetyl-gamma-glutamylphosphate reductase
VTLPSLGRVAFGGCVAVAFALMLAPVVTVMVISVFR